jgi:hypothetical protein
LLGVWGCSVWRQNNHATRGRKFIGRKGVPDIIGFDPMGGRAVYAEVKTVNDKLSDDQVKFLHEASEAGCRVYIVHQQGGAASIQEWRAYRAGKE